MKTGRSRSTQAPGDWPGQGTEMGWHGLKKVGEGKQGLTPCAGETGKHSIVGLRADGYRSLDSTSCMVVKEEVEERE